MTTIVWDKKVLASDTQMTNYGCEKSQEEVDKIFLLQGTYKGSNMKAVGVAGNATMAIPFKEWLEAGAITEQWIEEFSSVGAILVTDAKTYVFHNNKYPLEVNESTSIGSGCSFAASALSMGLNAINSVKHAIKHDIYSSGTIRYVDCTRSELYIDGAPSSVSVESVNIASNRW